jgi:hypothetical protein
MTYKPAGARLWRPGPVTRRQRAEIRRMIADAYARVAAIELEPLPLTEAVEIITSETRRRHGHRQTVPGVVLERKT